MNEELIQKTLKIFDENPSVKQKAQAYFDQNQAAQIYTEICHEENWPLLLDHLTVRTLDVERSAQKYLAEGWSFSEKVDYRAEGWWANVYRHPVMTAVFIDQAYPDKPEHIIKKWVERFGEDEYHHIAMLLPPTIEIEVAMIKLEERGVTFPGTVTGGRGSMLRQIFSAAQTKAGEAFSVLELAQRSTDPETGELYLGFISEQADSLMKDSTKLSLDQLDRATD